MTDWCDDFEIEHNGQVRRYPLGWPGLREAMCRWLDANGLDHREVCVPQRAVIADGKLTVWLYELNEDGDRFLRHPDDTQAAKVEATVLLTEEPPDPPRLSAS